MYVVPTPDQYRVFGLDVRRTAQGSSVPGLNEVEVSTTEEVVELMEANDADVPFEGTLDAVGLLDGLLEQAMEGLNLLGGE